MFVFGVAEPESRTMRTKKARILVVDDTPSNLRMIGRILKNKNYDVRLAPNGSAALASAQTEPPDLILLDIRMAGMGGHEVCKYLKSDERTRDVPVIFISALQETRDKVEALLLGGVDFITKPFHEEEVLARIKVHLDIRSLRDRLVESNVELATINDRLNREIDGRHRAEEALKTSEKLYRSTLSSISDAIFITDDKGEFIFICPNVDVIFGYSKEEVARIGNILKLLGELPFDRDRLEKTGELKNLDHEITDKSGNRHDLLVNVKRVKINGGTTLYSCRDITDRRAMEKDISKYQEKLRLLHSEMMNLEERERRQIASELHDNIGQKLAFLKMKLGALKETANACGLAGTFDEISRMTGEIIDNTRSLVYETGPPMLTELGFVSAIEWLIDKFQTRHGIEIKYCHDEDIPEIPSESSKILLFRVLRELLFNIVKHARANYAEIHLSREENSVRLTVEDNGIGFEVSNLENICIVNQGFGLFSIKERLRNLGGKLEIESEPGNGVKAVLTVPL